jgi:hypothetical protein
MASGLPTTHPMGAADHAQTSGEVRINIEVRPEGGTPGIGVDLSVSEQMIPQADSA